MLAQFLQSVDEAITDYERLFDETGKTMTLKRARDIIELRDLIARQSFSTLDDAMETFEARVANFNTGWWIFKTGNSRLKDNVLHMLEHYNQPLVRHMFESVKEIEYSIAESRQISVAPTSDEFAELRAALEKERADNAELRQRIAELEARNHALEQQTQTLPSGTGSAENHDAVVTVLRRA